MTTESPVFRVATEADREVIRRLHALTELWPDGEGELSDEFMEDDVRYVDQWSPERDGALIVEIDGANERAYRSYLAVGFEFVAAIPETEAAGYRTMLYRF
ncbi:MAG TPA: hypothetical protein GXZ46_03720 [Actinomycetales bacterium]|nr:hypothetical protein [Actinomycetales bacterium]